MHTFERNTYIMKLEIIPKVVISIILLTLLSNYIYSQQWCQPGARWDYYAWQGYPKLKRLEYIGDTTIIGFDCQIIQNNKRNLIIGPGGVSGAFPEEIGGKSFVRMSGDSLFYFQYNTFQFIYDFNAQQGDIWTIYRPEPDTLCPPETVLIDSVGIETINGVSMRWVAYTSSAGPGTAGEYTGKAYDRFGPINRFLFPEYDFDCNFAETDIHQFLCYSDDLLDSIGESYNCEYYENVSIEDLIKNQEMKLFPVPARGNLLLIQSDKIENAEYSVIDINGNTLVTGKISSKENSININGISNGIYFLKLMTRDKTSITKFIVAN